MYLDSKKKEEIFGQYGASNTDTGSVESQVALFSYRISHLTEHTVKIPLLNARSFALSASAVRC